MHIFIQNDSNERSVNDLKIAFPNTLDTFSNARVPVKKADRDKHFEIFPIPAPQFLLILNCYKTQGIKTLMG